MIYYIAYIKNNEIQTLKMASGVNEPEGVNEDGITIVHIDFPITDKFVFVKTHYWDGEWKEREEAPNRHAIWVDNAWVWDSDELMKEVRFLRNYKLLTSDWTQFSDSPLTEEKKSEWQSYRQTLRDLSFVPDNIISIDDVSWPTPPQ